MVTNYDTTELSLKESNISIFRLIHDRELTLFDGTRLLRHDKYDHLKEMEKLMDEDMAKR